MLTLPVLSGTKGHVSTFILIEHSGVFLRTHLYQRRPLTEMNLIKLGTHY